MEIMFQYLTINISTVVMILIAFLILSIFALSLYEFLNPKKQIVQEEIKDDLPSTIKYVDDDPDLEKTKAKLELQALREELRQQETEKLKVSSLAQAQELVPVKVEEAEEAKEEVKEVTILETFSPIGIVGKTPPEEAKQTSSITESISIKEEPLVKEEVQVSITEPIVISEEPSSLEEVSFLEETVEIYEEVNLPQTPILEEITSDHQEKIIEEKSFELPKLAEEIDPDADAIISFEELDKVIDQKTIENQKLYEEEKTLPISLNELYATAKMPQVELKDFYETKDDLVELENTISKISPKKEEPEKIELEDDLTTMNNFLNKLQSLRDNLN